MSPVGKTKDAGWQVGVSRTVPLDAEEVWVRLEDAASWLGEAPADVRTWKPLDRIRVGWRGTVVQVAMSPAATGTKVTFHQERMAGPDERERQRQHWTEVAERLFPELERQGPGSRSALAD